MASLKRKRYTAPIPPDAEPILHKGRPAVRVKIKGRFEIYPLTADGLRCRKPKSKLYAVYTLPNGRRKEVPLSKNKQAAESMLAELNKKLAFEEAGLRDPFADHRETPLADHLESWKDSFGKSSAKHARQTVGIVAKLFDACQFTFTTDIDPVRVEAYLKGLSKGNRPKTLPPGDRFSPKELAAMADVTREAVTVFLRRHGLDSTGTGNGKSRRYPRSTAEAFLNGGCDGHRGRGIGARTLNQHLAAAKQLCRWMENNFRMSVNPLKSLTGWNARLDKRHARRALKDDEARRLLEAAGRSERMLFGLFGRDRQALYLTALRTGYRAGELAHLTPAAFELDGQQPVIALAAGTNRNQQTKNGEDAYQFCGTEAAEYLKAYIAAKEAGKPVWPGQWYRNAAAMLREDLKAASIAYRVQGRNGPEVADFHSLRHLLNRQMGEANIDLQTRMSIMRHSDDELTNVTYGKPRVHNLAAAVDKLPSLLASSTESSLVALRAMGTDGKLRLCPPQCPPEQGNKAENAGTIGQSSDFQPLTDIVGLCLESLDLGPIREHSGNDGNSSATWTRTKNRPINSRMLYH